MRSGGVGRKQTMRRTTTQDTSGHRRIGAPGSLGRIFFDTNNQLMGRLIAAMNTGDVDTAIRAAHAMKGAGLFAGFLALADAAAEAEASLRTARFDRAKSAILRAKRLLRSSRARAIRTS